MYGNLPALSLKPKRQPHVFRFCRNCKFSSMHTYSSGQQANLSPTCIESYFSLSSFSKTPVLHRAKSITQAGSRIFLLLNKHLSLLTARCKNLIQVLTSMKTFGSPLPHAWQMQSQSRHDLIYLSLLNPCKSSACRNRNSNFPSCCFVFFNSIV